MASSTIARAEVRFPESEKLGGARNSRRSRLEHSRRAPSTNKPIVWPGSFLRAVARSRSSPRSGSSSGNRSSFERRRALRACTPASWSARHAATNAAPVKYKSVCSAETTEASGKPTGPVDGAWYRHVTDRGKGCFPLSRSFVRNKGTTDRRPSPSSTTPIANASASARPKSSLKRSEDNDVVICLSLCLPPNSAARCFAFALATFSSSFV
mmetsp:Transcript_6020/g.24391  ORF Transcript_6020/g.24391 Transcript_6020/m.24391 type:complete len:211 (+) Transcript_6020:1653-2285(+)